MPLSTYLIFSSGFTRALSLHGNLLLVHSASCHATINDSGQPLLKMDESERTDFDVHLAVNSTDRKMAKLYIFSTLQFHFTTQREHSFSTQKFHSKHSIAVSKTLLVLLSLASFLSRIRAQDRWIFFPLLREFNSREWENAMMMMMAFRWTFLRYLKWQCGMNIEIRVAQHTQKQTQNLRRVSHEVHQDKVTTIKVL